MTTYGALSLNSLPLGWKPSSGSLRQATITTFLVFNLMLYDQKLVGEVNWVREGGGNAVVGDLILRDETLLASEGRVQRRPFYLSFDHICDCLATDGDLLSRL